MTSSNETGWALEVLELDSADKAEILKYLQKEDFMLEGRSYEAVSLLADPHDKSEMYEYSCICCTQIQKVTIAF